MFQCKQQGLLASFEVLEMSEKAGGMDILTDGQYLKEHSIALSFKRVVDTRILIAKRQIQIR